MKYFCRLFSLLLTLVLVSYSTAWAIRMFCPNCSSLVELTDTTCKKCGKELNKCLNCNTLNPLFADYCENCVSPLAEMRVLGQIDEETRKELKLGQSERAQLDRELQSIDYQMEKDPSLTEKLLFRKARIYRQMNFPAKEAATWQEYLQKFPNTDKKNVINMFLSEAFRKWGYLFYMQKDLETALQKYEAAVSCNPGNVEAWLWIGRIKNEKKDSNGAADAYMKALEAEPGNKIAINFLKTMKRKIPPELLKPAPNKPQIPNEMLETNSNEAAKPTDRSSPAISTEAASSTYQTPEKVTLVDPASNAKSIATTPIGTISESRSSPDDATSTKSITSSTNTSKVPNTYKATSEVPASAAFETVEPEPMEAPNQTSIDATATSSDAAIKNN